MRAPGCGRLALPLLLLAAAALAEGDAKGLKEGETPGNFMEDEQWLSSISQYSGKIKHWNRFRDVSAQGGTGRGPGPRVWRRSFGAGTHARRSQRPQQPGRRLHRESPIRHPFPACPRPTVWGPPPQLWSHIRPGQGDAPGARARHRVPRGPGAKKGRGVRGEDAGPAATGPRPAPSLSGPRACPQRVDAAGFTYGALRKGQGWVGPVEGARVARAPRVPTVGFGGTDRARALSWGSLQASEGWMVKGETAMGPRQSQVWAPLPRGASPSPRLVSSFCGEPRPGPEERLPTGGRVRSPAGLGSGEDSPAADARRNPGFTLDRTLRGGGGEAAAGAPTSLRRFPGTCGSEGGRSCGPGPRGAGGARKGDEGRGWAPEHRGWGWGASAPPETP
nr:testican-2 isoform X1 [Oryctolagus cuniculus]